METYIIILLRDLHGNKTFKVMDELNVTVHITELRDTSGDKIIFESEAYHLKEWCEENCIEYREVYKELEYEDYNF